MLKCQLGMTLAKLNRNDDALVQLQQAINADRKNIISWIEKARVLQSMSKNQDALEVLKGALVRNLLAFCVFPLILCPNMCDKILSILQVW